MARWDEYIIEVRMPTSARTKATRAGRTMGELIELKALNGLSEISKSVEIDVVAKPEPEPKPEPKKKKTP